MHKPEKIFGRRLRNRRKVGLLFALGLCLNGFGNESRTIEDGDISSKVQRGG